MLRMMITAKPATLLMMTSIIYYKGNMTKKVNYKVLAILSFNGKFLPRSDHHTRQKIMEANIEVEKKG